MYNRATYNKTTYNRVNTFEFEWLATANVETASSGLLFVLRYLDSSVEAVTSSSGGMTRLLLFTGETDAISAVQGNYSRIRFFDAVAEAISIAIGAGVSTYGSATLELENISMIAGDELIIDTEHMTVTLNGANIVDRITDASVFFKLKSGENDIIIEGGTIADIKILWKDRWL